MAGKLKLQKKSFDVKAKLKRASEGPWRIRYNGEIVLTDKDGKTSSNYAFLMLSKGGNKNFWLQSNIKGRDLILTTSNVETLEIGAQLNLNARVSFCSPSCMTGEDVPVETDNGTSELVVTRYE